MILCFKSRFVILLILLLIFPNYGKASQMTRADLMGLARQFVDRVGQKLPPPASSPAQDPGLDSVVAQVPETELLLLTPRLANNVVVDATVGGYRRGGLLYLSFHEFCAGMAFPITFGPGRRTAEGWYIREKYPFKMDLDKGFVQSRADQFTVASSEWFVEDGVVYVSAESIRKWMHIDYEVKWESQLLDLAADVPFPLEDRIARRKRKNNESEYADVAQLPRVDNPPRLISTPSTQVSLGASYTKLQGAQQATRTSSATVTTAGDVLGHTTRGLVGGNSIDGLNTVRLKAEKRSEEADLLGPLRARKYEIGDLSPVDQILMGATEEQLGTRFTNARDNEQVGSTKRTFEGDLPPGWDVELYNENQLIAFQTVDDTGRYRFENVDLYAGDNQFRLVYYGPQGEVREEEVSVPINLETIGARKGLYDVSATLKNTHTYDKLKDEDEDRGTPDLSASYQQGLTEGLTVGTGVRAHQANGVRRTLVSGDLIARLGSSLFNVTVVTDEEFESAVQAIFRRSIGEHSIRSTTLFATDMFNPDNGDTPATVFRSGFDMRGPLFDFFDEKVSYALATNMNKRADDVEARDAQFSQNARYGRFTIGHALKWTSNTSATGEKKTETASEFNVRRTIGGTRVRAGARYVYAPQSELDRLSLSLTKNITDEIQGQVDIDHELDPSLTSTAMRMNWNNEHVVVSPSVTVTSQNEVRAMMNVRFGVVHDDETGKTKITRDLVNNQGGVVATVFLDKNGNNVLDGDDTLIEGAGIKSLQSSKFAKTGADGIAFISDLPEFMPTDIVLDNATLGDPFYISTFKGLSVLPRPGAPAHIEFPVHIAGEMDGKIVRATPNGMRPVGGVRVELINRLGARVASALTAYDGYYVLSLIPPGTYLVRVDPKELKDTGVRQPLPRVVAFGYDGAVIAGQDIYLDKGVEVPINIAQVSDRPVVTSGAVSHDFPMPIVPKISLVFGSYQSSLLSILLKYRIRLALNAENIPAFAIYDRPKGGGKEGENILAADVPGGDFQQAYTICQALVTRRLSCSLDMSPDLLMQNLEGRVAVANTGSMTGQ